LLARKELENGEKVLDKECMKAELPIVPCLHFVPLVASSATIMARTKQQLEMMKRKEKLIDLRVKGYSAHDLTFASSTSLCMLSSC